MRVGGKLGPPLLSSITISLFDVGSGWYSLDRSIMTRRENVLTRPPILPSPSLSYSLLLLVLLTIFLVNDHEKVRESSFVY